MTENTCSRCGSSIKKPVEKFANYCTHEDFTETEPVEVNYALRHTDETLKELDRVAAAIPERDRQALAAEMAHPDAPEEVEVGDGVKTIKSEGGETETHTTRTEKFSIPVEKYEQVEVTDPNAEIQKDEVAIVLRAVEDRDVQKTGLVCSDCTKDDDEIIWGPDK